ncbi:MAG TPA: acyl-CoA dehydrogenase family protein [Candidatus Limnocylindrales bacterium]|nr:acyl-CoA dehydrogenase family protein [Candidatus Limnocylindrales bacterium]
MDFSFTEEQTMIKQTVQDFVQRELVPRLKDLDENQAVLVDVMTKMGKLGLFGLPFSEEYGGSASGYQSYAIAVEEVARVCASTAISYAANCSLGISPIYYFGTEEQKQAWLPDCIKGTAFAAFGLTEPDAGSDAGGTKTKAILDGDHWLINGSKCFITNATIAKVAVITAVTEPDMGTRGISCFIIPTDTPGFKVSPPYDKLGLRASDTAEIILEDVRIPEKNLLGKRGEGFKQFMKILDGGRISIGALSVGIGQACLDASLNYARERKQFNRPIASFQAIQFKLADMATRVELSRLGVLRAAWLKDQGLPFTRESAIGKLFASETCAWAASEAVQIFGGYGYMKDYPVEKYFRDAKLMEIGEGTSEIQRLVIARSLGCPPGI